MFETRDTYLWVEKYRPDSLEGYIGNDKLKEKFARYIADQDIPHLLLVGPAGTGKTTAAKILTKHIDADILFLNASDENNIETVRSKIRGFAATRGFRPLKIIVLDEFDGFSQAGQGALRNIMEQFSDTTRFILTANYIERILEPIVSRTQTFTVIPPSKRDVAIHLAQILKKETVVFTPTDLKVIVDAYYPDIRKILNELQLACKDNTLVIDKAQIIEGDVKLKIIEVLKGKLSVDGKLTTIRKLIADAQLRDFTEVYRLLYDRVDDYAGNNISAAILAVAEGHRWDSLVVDKELNMAGTIINLLHALS
jgi:replication factor C small subunit